MQNYYKLNSLATFFYKNKFGSMGKGLYLRNIIHPFFRGSNRKAPLAFVGPLRRPQGTQQHPHIQKNNIQLKRGEIESSQHPFLKQKKA